jgi:predicted PurR-regulated permease PerM
MGELEQVLAMFIAAVLFASMARKVGAPYPVFLAIGGALLSFVPGAPTPVLPPDLVAGAIRCASSARCGVRRLSARLT